MNLKVFPPLVNIALIFSVIAEIVIINKEKGKSRIE